MSDNTQKLTVKALYKQFLSYPKAKRVHIFKHPLTKEGYQHDVEFAEVHGVDPATLYRWKIDPEFQRDLENLRRLSMIDIQSDVYFAVGERAAKGEPAAVKQFLEWMSPYMPKEGELQGQEDKKNLFESPGFIEIFAMELVKAMNQMDEVVISDKDKLADKLARAIKPLVVAEVD